MSRSIVSSTGLVLAAGFMMTGAAHASPDIEYGMELHEESCIQCHSGYTPAESKIKTLASLNTRVQGCATNLNLPWFEEDVAAVTAYINQEYFKFTD